MFNPNHNNRKSTIENIAAATINTNQNITTAAGSVMLGNQSTSETNPATGASNTTTTKNTTGTIPKEKSSKAAKNQQPRKPPPTIETFWPSIMQEVQNTTIDAKHQALPLARIKKIMKLDENARMIAAEAPLLFAKACEFFIQELTMRAWIHTDESKRRTLQRSDIAQAIANYDQFDFLIDIVPREDIKPSNHHRKHHSNSESNSGGHQNKPSSSSAQSAASHGETTATTSDILNVAAAVPATINTGGADVLTANAVIPTATAVAGTATVTNNQQQPAQVLATTTTHPTQQLQIIHQPQPAAQTPLQYFITLPGQQPQLVHQLQLQQQQQIPNLQPTSLNVVAAAQQPQQLILTAANTNPAAGGGVPHHQQQQAAIFQNFVPQHQQPTQHPQQQHPHQQQVQLLQQVMVTPTGEIANMPITINANQLQFLRQPQTQHHQQQAHQHQAQQQQQQQHQQTTTQTAAPPVLIPYHNF
ncbi:nuclear transcription factor Y subunit gamma-like [Musca vetustissima]|uniref:nuclear transcription factor Y subunit gamma-like n=1 Tax=Musca vetustissima TaxID=27455 RepID=UPI002AB7BCFF|nr:nuclear transcription factor Y subunit gamma-like [Musca vetustissima]